MNYTQRKELAKRGYTEERLQDFAKNQIVQIGEIVTPSALKKRRKQEGENSGASDVVRLGREH